MIAISPARIVKEYLVAQSVGLLPPSSSDWVIYVANMGGIPDNALCVYDTGVTDDGRMPSGERIEHPNIQVRIRSKDYDSAWIKGIEVRDALDAISDTNIVVASNTYIIHNVMRTSSLIPLGIDPETRLINVTLNAEFTVSLP